MISLVLVLIGLVDIEQGFEWDRERMEEIANEVTTSTL